METNHSSLRVGIVGASGYSGEELVGLLLGHPRVELTALTSRQYAGRSVADIFPRFGRRPAAASLAFIEPDVSELARRADLIFLALPHGVAAEYAVPALKAGLQVIDLSADFRLRSAAVYEEFYGAAHPAPDLLEQAVYGLTEFRRDALKDAQLVASPGCYPTSILMPLIPLLRAGVISKEGVIVNSISGASGAGRKADLQLLYVEINESLRPYGVPKHRHLSEIEQELSIAAGDPVTIQFTPTIAPVNRGILSSISVVPPEGRAADSEAVDRVRAVWNDAFEGEPFVRPLPRGTLPDTKNVVGTNGIEFSVCADSRTNRLIIHSVEDNLVKGASGQAIQSMNVMCGFDETAGLV